MSKANYLKKEIISWNKLLTLKVNNSSFFALNLGENQIVCSVELLNVD